MHDLRRLWPALFGWYLYPETLAHSQEGNGKAGVGPIGGQAKMPEVIKDTGNPYNMPAEDRFNPWFPEDIKVAERADIAYYAGCTGAYSAQPMVKGDVLVLKAIGEHFTMLPPEEEVCCGFPLFASGQHDMLEDLTKRLVQAYKAKGVKLLLSSCPCCVNIMSRDWPIFYGQELPFKIRHMTQFAVEALKSGKLKIREGLSERLIYHDPCYLSRGVGYYRRTPDYSQKHSRCSTHRV